MTKENVTKVIFWLGFMAFLATSVPHVAWLYKQYEPDTIVYWILAYGIAVGIDVLIAWLSFVQSASNRVDNALTWLFIACLCLLSWYANYLYSMAHNPLPVHNLWGIFIPFTSLTTGEVTPAIVSALPVFVIAYTFMLHIVNNTAHETLEQKATRLEKERTAKERIREATKGTFTSKIKDAISGAGDIASHAKNSLQSSVVAIETPKIGETDNTPALALETPTALLQTQQTPIEEEAITYATLPILSVQSDTIPETPIVEDVEEEKHTDRLEAVTVSSNGHDTTSDISELAVYVPKSRRSK